MAIQGLENKSLLEIRIKNESKLKDKKSSNGSKFTVHDSIDSPKVQSPDKNRSDLLLAIRSKIKKGFYNSDAVLDDLSYGFAEALDQTV